MGWTAWPQDELIEALGVDAVAGTAIATLLGMADEWIADAALSGSDYFDSREEVRQYLDVVFAPLSRGRSQYTEGERKNISQFYGERVNERLRLADRLQGAVRAAIEACQQALGCSRYRASKLVVDLFRSRGAIDKKRRFHLSAEAGVEPPADIPLDDLPDDTDWLEKIDDVYMPAAIVAMADADLPDGAILPMIRAFSQPRNEYTNFPLSDGSDLPEVQLARYGDRLVPYLWRVLSAPHRYTLSDRAGGVRHGALELVSTLSRDRAVPLVRAAIEAGWDGGAVSLDAYALLDDEELRDELRNEYAGSPYRMAVFPRRG